MDKFELHLVRTDFPAGCEDVLPMVRLVYLTLVLLNQEEERCQFKETP